MTLKDFSNSLNLRIECSLLIRSKPPERLDRDLNPLTSATEVPYASDHAINEQNWEIAGLTGW